MIWASITDFKIPLKTLHRLLQAEDCGGFVTFEGRVRNHHRGLTVTGLHYEAYQPMARRVLRRVIAEAYEKWGAKKILVTHRVGEISIGEMAIWIGVATPHRKEAFQTAEFLIDEIKKRVPIWKQEFYQDGSEAWIQCSHMSA